MQTLTLTRDYAGKDCTLGTLTLGALSLKTMERPWIPDPRGVCGHPDTSCVPAGVYELALHNTPKFPKHFALVNAALGIYNETLPAGMFGRTACLIHSANIVEQLEGCCAVGRERLISNGKWMITESRDAYVAFAAAVPWKTGYSLIIEYAAGVSA